MGIFPPLWGPPQAQNRQRPPRHLTQHNPTFAPKSHDFMGTSRSPASTPMKIRLQ